MHKEWTVDEVIAIGEEMRKQVIASAAPEERLAGLEPAELEMLLQQLQTYLGQSTKQANTAAEAAIAAQRQTLIHVLQHKFGTLPSHLVEQIEATADHHQLTRWLDSALDAQALAEIDFEQ